MQVDFGQRVIAPPNVLMQALDGEAMFLNMEGETYYGLDSVGSRAWQVLTTASTIEDAYDLLLREFDVEPDRLRGDLEQLIPKLHAAGLIEIVRE